MFKDVLWPGKSHGRRSLEGCSPWGPKELGTTERLPFTFHFHALEKEMATHSGVLAWRIPGTGIGGLPSTGLHRVRHEWRDLAAAAAATLHEQFFPSHLICAHFGRHLRWLLYSLSIVFRRLCLVDNVLCYPFLGWIEPCYFCHFSSSLLNGSFFF